MIAQNMSNFKWENVVGIYFEVCFREYDKSLQIIGKYDQKSMKWLQVLTIRNWETLMVLKMEKCNLMNDDVNTICRMNWPKLEYLSLAQNQIQSQGVIYIIDKRWPKLKTLKLLSNQIGDEGANLILNSQLKLYQLCLGFNKITHFGLTNITHRKLSSLVCLELSNKNIGIKGIKLLTKASLPNLKILELLDSNLQNEGTKHLTKGNWPHLCYLNLDFNRIKFDGNYYLSNFNNWPQINELIIKTQKYHPQIKDMERGIRKQSFSTGNGIEILNYAVMGSKEMNLRYKPNESGHWNFFEIRNCGFGFRNINFRRVR